MNYKITAFDIKLALLQYYRFKRQSICVDEFRGADVIIDNGKEIHEVEVKISRYDLLNGEKKKTRKHEYYRSGRHNAYCYANPNKYSFCVPETLVNDALEYTKELNPKYGVIGFDVEKCLSWIQKFATYNFSYFIRIAKSAKNIHEGYSNIQMYIARRCCSSLITSMENHLRRNLRKAQKG